MILYMKTHLFDFGGNNLRIKDDLTTREKAVLKHLWDWNEPLTQNEMAERLTQEGWSSVTLFKTVQSLSEKGYLEVAGLEKTVKTYARKLVPALTKEEYYASVLMKDGISAEALANITAAFIEAGNKSDPAKKEAVIAKLEEIIASIRED